MARRPRQPTPAEVRRLLREQAEGERAARREAQEEARREAREVREAIREQLRAEAAERLAFGLALERAIREDEEAERRELRAALREQREGERAAREEEREAARAAERAARAEERRKESVRREGARIRREIAAERERVQRLQREQLREAGGRRPFDPNVLVRQIAALLGVADFEVQKWDDVDDVDVTRRISMERRETHIWHHYRIYMARDYELEAIQNATPAFREVLTPYYPGMPTIVNIRVGVRNGDYTPIDFRSLTATESIEVAMGHASVEGDDPDEVAFNVDAWISTGNYGAWDIYEVKVQAPPAYEAWRSLRKRA